VIKSKLIKKIESFAPINKNEITQKNKNITHIERDYFTDEELEKIADSYKNDLERLIIAILLSTGIRLGGLRNLKVKNVYDDKLNVKSDAQRLKREIK